MSAAEIPDHRALGHALEPFLFQDDAPGMVFRHPRGLVLHGLRRETARRRCRAEGYREVATPQRLRDSIGTKSGHWSHCGEQMYAFDDGHAPVALKTVSCPGHLEIARRARRRGAAGRRRVLRPEARVRSARRVGPAPVVRRDPAGPRAARAIRRAVRHGGRAPAVPPMLHRALSGSLERFVGILLEHWA